MKSIHVSCWHWSFISKMGTHMAGMAQVVDRHLGGHYSSSHLDSRVWGAPLLKLKSSMERLRFESYTGHYLPRMLVVPYTSSRGPEPRWEGNTDKVMYWHGLRMLRYSHCHPHSGIEFCESQPLLPRTVIIFLVIHCGQCWMSGTASTKLLMANWSLHSCWHRHHPCHAPNYDAAVCKEFWQEWQEPEMQYIMFICLLQID